MKKWAKGKGGKSAAAAGEVRRSQLIGTYGAGAMIDLVDVSVLVGGIHHWMYGGELPVISEPRLVSSLMKHGIHLDPKAALRAPPECDDDEPDPHVGIQALEFPAWMVCQSCSALVRASSSLEKKKGRYYHTCATRAVLVPVRFVVACPNGHLDEFPWADFVHRDAEKPCQAPSMSLREDASGELYDTNVVCDCGARQRMSVAQSLGQWYACTGTQPWLGRGAEFVRRCENTNMRMQVRTSSSAYFPQVWSALSIDDPDDALEKELGRHTFLHHVPRAAFWPVVTTNPNCAELARYDEDEVWEALQALKRGETRERPPIRATEYRRFLMCEAEKPGDQPGLEDEFFAVRLNAPMPAGLSRVVLASKLREVRAQVGFTRLAPLEPDMGGESELSVKTAPLGHETNWLPAVAVRGEGIFIELDEERLRAWEAREAVKLREAELRAGWEKEFKDRPELEFFGARYYLLHALSHLLIQAISLECGYSASSLHERIYCAPRGMAGILLTTTTPGSEGTLGGLVEQGRQIHQHLHRALRLAELCSNDPICATHSPVDQDERHLEGAACHGCLYLAEVSCERMNRILDRALVVPTIDHRAELAFFPAPSELA